MSDRQLGWLIEANGSYWDGRIANEAGFTTDPNEAVRFVRMEDAERVKYWLLKDHAFALRSTQHVWLDSPVPPHAAGEEEPSKCNYCGEWAVDITDGHLPACPTQSPAASQSAPEMPDRTRKFVEEARSGIRGRTYHADADYPRSPSEHVCWLADRVVELERELKEVRQEAEYENLQSWYDQATRCDDE